MQEMSAVLGSSMRAVFRPATGELLLTFSCNGINITLSTAQGPVLQHQQQEQLQHQQQLKSSEASNTTAALASQTSGAAAAAGVEVSDVGGGGSVGGGAELPGAKLKGDGDANVGELDGDISSGNGGGSDVSALLARAKALMADTAAVEAQEAVTAAGGASDG
jgi:hypothetical protein